MGQKASQTPDTWALLPITDPVVHTFYMFQFHTYKSLIMLCVTILVQSRILWNKQECPISLAWVKFLSELTRTAPGLETQLVRWSVSPCRGRRSAEDWQRQGVPRRSPCHKNTEDWTKAQRTKPPPGSPPEILNRIWNVKTWIMWLPINISWSFKRDPLRNFKIN